MFNRSFKSLQGFAPIVTIGIALLKPQTHQTLVLSDWTKRLQVAGKKRLPKPTFFNAVVALREAPDWQCVLAYDDFAKRTVLTAPPPWSVFRDDVERPWTDIDDLLTWEWLQSKNILVQQRTCAQAVELVAHDRPFNPVLDDLDSVGKWDGVPRLDEAFSKYFGVTNNDYTQTVSRCFFIGAVARARDPGCQCDSLPILEGLQGLGKSSGCRVLFDPFFSDEIADIGSKDASLQLQGVWCIEISELDAMSRADVSKAKAFLSRRTDRFRVPYGHRPAEYPRSCIFIGTTNPSAGYWKDETGGRRIWPVKCEKPIDLIGLRAVRDQLWAEAVQLYEAGAVWYIVNPKVLKLAEDEQADRYVGDPWTEQVLLFIDKMEETAVSDILETCLCVSIDKQDQVGQNRVSRILRSNKWERVQKREGNVRTWVYRRIKEPKGEKVS